MRARNRDRAESLRVSGCQAAALAGPCGDGHREGATRPGARTGPPPGVLRLLFDGLYQPFLRRHRWAQHRGVLLASAAEPAGQQSQRRH